MVIAAEGNQVGMDGIAQVVQQHIPVLGCLRLLQGFQDGFHGKVPLLTVSCADVSQVYLE